MDECRVCILARVRFIPHGHVSRYGRRNVAYAFGNVFGGTGGGLGPGRVSDVPILQTAIERRAKVVALSALMTTTMMQMKVVIDAVRERSLPFKVVIGGAVVTPDFAREIQADGFSTDVGTVVSEMERVIALLEAAR